MTRGHRGRCRSSVRLDHDVNSGNNTKFVMLSMWNAGLRVADVRNPEDPVEVAYFNPGMVAGRLDQAWGHVRYVEETGHIWFSSATGGFWIVQLQPQVLAHFEEKPPVAPAPELTLPIGPEVAPLPEVPTYAVYCTLDGATATGEQYVPGIRDLVQGVPG